MHTGWRARLFHLTRESSFLWKGVIVILGSSIGIAMMIIAANRAAPVMEVRTRDEESPAAGSSTTFDMLLSGEPRPADLADWLRTMAEFQKQLPKPSAFDPSLLILGGNNIRQAIDRQFASPVQRDVFADYARFLFLANAEQRQEAALRVHDAASKTTDLRFVHEISGEIHMGQGALRQALEDYVVEAKFADATRARRIAFRTALQLRDHELIARLMKDERYVKDLSPVALLHGAELVNDRWTLFNHLLRWIASQWVGWEAALGLLSAGIWYGVLVYGSSAGPWRWIRHLPAVILGAISVVLLTLFQTTLHYGLAAETRSILHELVADVVYVGLPEEAAKLALFACLVPLLVWQRASRAEVALGAGLVGLGFALAENVRYFVDGSVDQAPGRLLTANFMHIAMTGLVGVKFALLIKSRFHRLDEFLIPFVGVVLAHGGYDFACGPTAAGLGISMLNIVILAVLTKQYLHEIRPAPSSRPRQTVSRVAVFVFGTTALVGAVMIVSALQGAGYMMITGTLKSTLGLVPVALLYMREFGEA